MNTTLRNLLACLAMAALIAPACGAPSTLAARLQPQSLDLGDSAQLSITVNGSQAPDPSVPEVDGLDIIHVGQQTSMQMINGNVTANATHIYRVTPHRAGSFTIPSISISGAGSTEPLTLRVGQGTGGRAQRSPAQRGSTQATPSLKDEAGIDPANPSAFLHVVLPKQELTVGELVPVEIKAYFRAGVSASLNGLPMLSSDAFTLNKLSDKPEQTREKINGALYTVVTWTSSLSAVKAGDYPLNLDMPVMVRVQDKPKRRSGGNGGARGFIDDFFGGSSPFGGSMFDDSFFDDFFGGVTEKPLTLHTAGTEVKIKPLPLQGRPAGFSGAVGEFDVTAENATPAAVVGDPLKLKITVSGRGNFSRVATPGLPASSDWKSYQPSVQFAPGDSAGTTGTKTFEQSIVPLRSGPQTIPAVNFSYFDPQTEKYVTKSTQPIPVEIAPGGTAPAAIPVAVASTTEAQADRPADGLAPDMVVRAHVNGTLQPLVLRPWFITVNGGLLAALLVGSLMRSMRKRHASDPERLHWEAAERAIKQSIANMDSALQAEDASRFFEAARHALQARLAAQWQVPPSKVTLPEIRSRLNGHAEGVSTIFQIADEIAYSGRRFSTPDLQQWRDRVKNELQQLAQS
jgi:oxygen tolerance protein BatD